MTTDNTEGEGATAIIMLDTDLNGIVDKWIKGEPLTDAQIGEVVSAYVRATGAPLPIRQTKES